MNQSPPPKRPRFAPKRIAAATATVVGAALLTYPGTVTAQTTGIDCAALGEQPSAPGTEGALEIAVECGVEVLIEHPTTDYDSYYATPDGRLHQVSTVPSAEMLQAQGAADPTLTEVDGALVQTDSQWDFYLGTGGELPLVRTDAASLFWEGTTPTPAHSGAEAFYDELAPGLDLILDARVPSLGLRFTVQDAEAWDALASGLTLDPVVGSGNVLQDTLYLRHPSDYHTSGTWEQTTRFHLRDSAGAGQALGLTIGTEGALELSPAEGTVEAAAFPLTVTAQWAYHQLGVNEWGSVTSASSDLVLFGGDGGLDEPYFTAAGQGADAVVGPYCDALVDPECQAPAEAATYWNFWGPIWGDIVPSGLGVNFTTPVTEASFQVDAAVGSDCIAPELSGTGVYRLNANWDNRPGLSSTRRAVQGVCQDGTAVYDLSSWITATGTLSGPTLGMTSSSETARFDGSSARFEVYRDLYAFGMTMSRCPGSYDPDVQASELLRYGGFRAALWRPDLIDQGLTWTATVLDYETDQVVASSEPADLVAGYTPYSSFTVPDGYYVLRHEVESDSGLRLFQKSCYYVVDTKQPEFVDITVSPGPHRIGDTVTVDFTVADEGFPSRNSLTLWCVGGSQCENVVFVEVNDDGTASFEVRLPRAVNKPRFVVEDGAGNEISSDTIVIPATNSLNDYNGDGHQDMIAVRKADGNLMLYAGRGDGTFESAVSIGTGWGKMDIAMIGDVTGDGIPDLFARDTKTGTAYTYKGNGSGGVGSRVVAGTGWQDIGAIGTAGELFDSTDLDVLSVDRSDGKLYYNVYAGSGSGEILHRIVVGDSGWNAMDNVTGVGDVDNDGFGDIMARDSRTGIYYIYYYFEPYGELRYGRRTALGTALGNSPERHFDQVVNLGDLNGDGYNDLVGVDSRAGELVSFSYGENAALVRSAEVIGSGWGKTRLPNATSDRTYDFNGDGAGDVFVRRGSDGKLYFYSGDGATGFGPIGTWGTEFKGLSLIETAGDFDGDGFADLIGRDFSGVLYLYPGNGDGSYTPANRVQIGTGWNALSAIVSGQDFNGDGAVDVMAREKSTGYLWFYPGTGDGGFGSRVKIGSGWNSLREITAAGDLNHDGHADVLAVWGSNQCMYFYEGRGDGTLRPAVRVGCHWVGYDSVAAVGDFNGDGHADWVARRQSDGAVYLYKGNGAGGYGSRTQIQTNWTWANTIA